MNRSLLAGLAIVLAGSGTTALAQSADAYPSKPIRIAVTSAVGGLLDAHTRLFAQKMSEKLGQSIVVDNRPGADGMLAISFVKAAPADGYTLLATSDTIASRAARKQEPGYDLEKDFTGVGQLSRAPIVLLTASTQPDKNFSEFAARVRANPGKFSYASSGAGTTTHLAAALLAHQQGLSMLHVPYKGNAAAKPDVMGGRVNVMFGVLADLSSDKLRALGVSSSKRLATFPEVPTIAEQGAGSFSYYPWFGIMAPAGTPKDIVQKLNEAMRAAAASDDIRRYMDKEGSELVNATPEQFTLLARDTKIRVEKLATDLGWSKE